MSENAEVNEGRSVQEIEPQKPHIVNHSAEDIKILPTDPPCEDVTPIITEAQRIIGPVRQTPYLPKPPVVPLTMDSTAHIEFSIVNNQEYSKEIIEETNGVVNLEELQKLKSTDKEKFLQLSQEQVIDLLKRVCTVSVETVNIIKQMEFEK